MLGKFCIYLLKLWILIFTMVIEIKWTNNCSQVFLLPMFVISCYSMNKLYFTILLRKNDFSIESNGRSFSSLNTVVSDYYLCRDYFQESTKNKLRFAYWKRFWVKNWKKFFRSKRSFGVNKSYPEDFRFQKQFNRWMAPDLLSRWPSTVRVWNLVTYLSTDPGQWRGIFHRIPLVSLIYHLFSTFVPKILSLWAFRRLFSVLCALCWFMRFQVRPHD